MMPHASRSTIDASALVAIPELLCSCVPAFLRRAMPDEIRDDLVAVRLVHERLCDVRRDRAAGSRRRGRRCDTCRRGGAPVDPISAHGILVAGYSGAEGALWGIPASRRGSPSVALPSQEVEPCLRRAAESRSGRIGQIRRSDFRRVAREPVRRGASGCELAGLVGAATPRRWNQRSSARAARAADELRAWRWRRPPIRAHRAARTLPHSTTPAYRSPCVAIDAWATNDPVELLRTGRGACRQRTPARRATPPDASSIKVLPSRRGHRSDRGAAARRRWRC